MSNEKTKENKPDKALFSYADNMAETYIDRNFEGRSMFYDGVHRFLKNKGAVAGLFFILLIVFFSVFGPSMTKYAFDEVHVEYQNLPPRIPFLEKYGIFDGTRNGVNVYEEKGAQDLYFYFGTDVLGRDLWARVFTGTRVSLLIAVIAVLADMLIGVIYGVISGFFGGTADMVMQRIIEIIYGIPSLVVVTLLMLLFKPGLGTIILALLISGWIGMSRLVRAQVLKLKEQEYVLASRTLGASSWSLIFREILPNTFGQIVIMSMMSVPNAIFTEAFLSYIGLGIPAPNASLGVLICDGYKSMMMYPYRLIIPVVIFAVLMISLNLVADGLRDALDPKMKER